MTEQHIQAKLKSLLKQEQVQLWKEPYTKPAGLSGQQHLQELAERYAAVIGHPVAVVGGALETIRVQAVRRGEGNQAFRETQVATLELLLPRDASRDTKKKTYLQTKLDVPVQEVMDRISAEYGLQAVKLILGGRTLSPDQTLQQQGTQNNSKLMVLRVSSSEEEERMKSQTRSVQRTHKGFQILSQRDEGSDPDTRPFLEIADQKGEPLQIPPSQKKALIVAMGFHERGRALMKRKQYEDALCHLLQADQHFGQCGSALLALVDNFAVLQLDVVWCYRALEALPCLEDGRQRLQTAEDCFLRCYGQQQQRLLRIKGNTGREEVLFLRLYLLQSLLDYIDGNDTRARQKLLKVEELYSRLALDPEQMVQLMALGFSEQEARLGLRACGGNLNQAALHCSTRRQEQAEQRERERARRRLRLDAIAALQELGFSRGDAARALHHTQGDRDRAYAILMESSQAIQVTNNNTEESPSPDAVEQLLSMGFQRHMSQAALRLTGGDVQSATQLLLDNQGLLPPELLSPSPPSSSSEPSTSSESAEEQELVSELLEDLSPHEEDYLDLTLEEESELIATIRSYLCMGGTHSA